MMKARPRCSHSVAVLHVAPRPANLNSMKDEIIKFGAKLWPKHCADWKGFGGGVTTLELLSAKRAAGCLQLRMGHTHTHTQ